MTQATSRYAVWQVALIVLVALALLAAYTVAFHAVFTSQVPGANDFFSRWAGAHLLFTRAWNPYGDQTSLWIQNAIWGHPAGPDEDPSLFAYPYYTVFLVAPYALVGDYSWAQAAWQVTLQVVTVASLLLLLAYHRWRPSPPMLGVLVFWMLAFYPTTRSLILGQIALVVYGLTLWALRLLMRPAGDSPTPAGDRLAGVLLAVTTVKPQMQFLIIPFLMLWAWRERRWQVMIAFAVSMAVLLGVSFALLPTWLSEWLAQVRLYPAYTPPAVLNILTREILLLGSAAGPVKIVLGAALAAYLLYEWWHVLVRRQDHRMTWAIGLTLVVTHLVALRTATTHFVVFTFPLVAIVRDLARDRPSGTPGTLAALGLMLFLAIGMWWLFLATLDGRQEANLVHVPLPLLMLVLLWITKPPGDSPAVHVRV